MNKWFDVITLGLTIALVALLPLQTSSAAESLYLPFPIAASLPVPPQSAWEQLGQMASSVASPPTPANHKIASNLGLLLSLRQDGDPVSSSSPVGQALAHIQDEGFIEVSARFTRELSAAERAEIEALGVEFQQVAGRLAHLDRFYGLLVPVEAVDGLAAHPLVEWLEAVWRPVVPAPLDTSIPTSTVPAVWQIQKTVGVIATPLTGKGVTIANFDTGVDVHHPAFLDGSENLGRTDWDTCTPDDDVFTSGCDAIPLMPGVLRYWNAQGDPNDTGFDLTQDWIYQDANNNGNYDTNELVYMAWDADGDKTLRDGEQLIRRGDFSTGIPASKIAATLDGSSVQRTRDTDLEQTVADTNGHGTSVAGILVGGNALHCAPGGMTCLYVYPNTRRYTGVAPNADLLVADRLGLNTNANVYVPWAAGLGADVMLYEYGQWIQEYMDGSSNHEQLMDAASVISGVVQVAPTGNIHGEGRHLQYSIPSGNFNHSFNVPVLGGGITDVFISMLWLNPSNNMTVQLTMPGTSTAVVLPCNTSPSGWKTVTTAGHTIKCERAVDSPRGTALYNVHIIRVAGIATGPWIMGVNNPSISAEPTNFYIADNATTWGGGAAWVKQAGWKEKHTATWPSTCDTCIGVASYATRGRTVGSPGDISPFSGRGPRFFDGAQIVDVAAPGHYDIISPESKNVGTFGYGKYQWFGGTSAAAPHVAGVAALLVQFADNDAAPADIETAIQRGAVTDGDTGSTPNDTWGYGKLDAYGALQNMMHDLGDAPDSSNHYSVSMSAYPGVQANFPTVYTGTTPLAPHGPIHWQAGSLATGGPVDSCLGWMVTAEGEADQGSDEEGGNNIIPPDDMPNRETGTQPWAPSDDGLGLWPASVMTHCVPQTLTYYVNLVTGTVGTHYVNLWFDWNRDGDWGDVFTCTTANDAPEWAVQDQVITKTTPGIHTISTLAFLPYQPADPYDPAWVRITLSERQAPTDTLTSQADGRGPPEGYIYGETEDYYFMHSPVVSFQVATTTVCVSNTVAFTNTTTGSKPITYSWDFGDGLTLITTTFLHPTHHYAFSGTLKTELSTIDALGMPTSQPYWVWITVNPSPVVGFTSNSPVRANTTAIFTNTSTGATSYYWDFGDGIGASTAVSPTYVYTSTGAYVVTLIAYNDEGCSNTYTDTVTVISPSPFTISKTAASSVVAGQPLTYTITVSNTGGTATSSVVVTDALPTGAFYVRCGGGACSESGGVVTWSGLTIPSHGTISVTFVVTACSGPLVNSAYGVASWSEGAKQTREANRAESVRSVSEGAVTTIVEVPNLAAAFTPASISIPINETVTFTDASTTDGGSIVAWGWDFGDGETGLGQVVDHTYADAGIYTVTLIVTDACGYTGMTALADVVTVHQPVLSIGKQAQGTAVVGTPLTFTLTVTNTDPLAEATEVVITDAVPVDAGYLWGGSHVDGVVSWTVDDVAAGGGSAQVTFAVTTCQTTIINAQYRVVTSAQGIASPWGAPLVASLDPPTLAASFDHAPMSLLVGGSVYFTDTSTTDGSSIVVWGWDFGDGETGSGQTIHHTYDATSAYTVTLVVTDACGYADTVQMPSAVTVVSACTPVSGAAFTFSPAVPLTGATVTFTGTVAVTSTPPVFYAWNFGAPSTRHKIAQGTSSVVTHTYDVSDTYAVVMTATNACGEDVASDTITVESPPCTGLNGVSINGLASGYTGVLYTFTADIAPSNATTPTIYTWSHTPDSGQGTASASYQWAAPGVYTITLTAENCGGAVSDTHAITIETPPGAVIDPLTGGVVVYTDTQGMTTTVQVPPGAVSETITLVYTPIDSPTQAISPGLRFAGHAFTLEAYKGGELQIGFVFSEPVTITIHYSEDDVQGIDEESLTLNYWNGSAWEDAACGLDDRRPDENLLAVPVCHLSEFALLGEAEYRIYLPLVANSVEGQMTRQPLSTYQDLQPMTKYDRVEKKAGSKR
jgi:uncharacterized repeat protein (TIGR01451 family)